MRICFLGTSSLDYPSPRGRWLPLAHELARQGNDIQLLLLHHCYDKLTRDQRRQEQSGVLVNYVGQMHVYGPIGQRRYFGSLQLLHVSLRGALALLRATLRARPAAIHVCKPQPINGLAGITAARRLGIPLYVDCDDYEAGGNRFGATWQQQLVQCWEDDLPKYAAGVTVNTRFLQQRYQALGITAQQIVYVPNGIAASRLQPPQQRAVAGLRAGLGLAGHPVVAYVGTLSLNTHNVGLLLEAFALVAQQQADARLLLVGDGEDRQLLMRRVKDLGLASQTLFTGAVPAAGVPSYLALADCLVDPVDDDPVAQARSPLKIVESLALGIPVVTGNVGDRSEMLGDRAGIVVAAGSPQALADGILTVIENTEQRAGLAKSARQQAENYRWDRLVWEWMSVYERGMKSR